MMQNCMIWVKNPMGIFCGIEVKQDQGIIKMGKILTRGFKAYRKARELISLGTLEKIGKDINECFCHYDDNVDDLIIEKTKNFNETGNKKPDINHYYFINNNWFIKKGFLFRPIEDVL